MTAAPLASLLYAPNDRKSQILADFAARRARDGVAVDGVVVETLWLDARTKCGLQVRALAGGRAVPLTRPYSDGVVVGRWQLLPEGLAAMTAILEAAVAAGAGLLVVDKFGPLEGRGEGMAPALSAALTSAIPLVVAVRREFAPAWRAFVADAAPQRLAAMAELPPEAAALEAWWARTVRASA